jgi:hypothetical protein
VATSCPACAEPGAAITIWRARVEGCFGRIAPDHMGWPYQNDLLLKGSPVISWLPSLGVHKYGATAYQDLGYGRE